MRRQDIELIAISSDPNAASRWHAAGVNRVMVDLETHGKAERQRHRDTVKSAHAVRDVDAVRSAVPGAHVVARCEPVSLPSWSAHIESVIAAGPTSVMLPMVGSVTDVEVLVEAVAGRAELIVMIETAAALDHVEAIASVLGEGTLFVGLNDLHIQLGQRFMFEPLSSGHVDAVAEVAHRHGLMFGFGGLARAGSGLVDPLDVVREHVRLGSSLAILARSFFGALADPFDVEQVRAGIAELRLAERLAHQRSAEEMSADARATADKIDAVAAQMARPR